jgi:class 3 adenylate cyclase
MLDAALADPAKAATLEADLDAAFGCDAAVLVIDMSGFSVTAEREGIGSALLQIRRLQLAAGPIITAHGGELVKFAADNVFAMFPTVPAAHAAALEIVAAAPSSGGISVGRILAMLGDFFGVDVNRASKLGEDEARRDQVLMTPAAAAAI